MTKKIILFLTMTIVILTINGQEYSLIKLGHNQIRRNLFFCIDELELDSAMFWSLHLSGDNIKKVKEFQKGDSTIVKISTNMPVSLNGTILSKKSAKEGTLPLIKKEDIVSIIKLTKEQTVPIYGKKYGKKGRRGMLIIETK